MALVPAGRPPIPLPVARLLRQEAGFGCCSCGLPILQYHHIVPYHDDDPYPPNEMMVLCPLHHDAATKRALTPPEQWDMKANPFNIQNGFVDGKLKINQPYSAVQVGGNLFVSDRAVVSIDGEAVLGLSADDRGRLSLSVTLYDQHGALLAYIENNEWMTGDPLPWDLESDYQYLRLRRDLGDIVIEIDARPEPISLRADLWRNGSLVSLSPQAVEVGHAGNVGTTFQNLGFVGMELNVSTTPVAKLMIEPHPEHGAGMFVSGTDDHDRLRRSVLAWRHLRDPASVPDPAAVRLGRNDLCWCGSGEKLKRCHMR